MSQDGAVRRGVISWRDLPIGRKALIVIAIPVLPLIATAGLYFQSAAQFQAALDDANRAWQNRAAQAEVYFLLVEAESANRAYLITGNPLLLQQRQRAAEAVMGRIDELGAHTRDPLQRARIPQLRTLALARLEALDAAALTTHEAMNAAAVRMEVDRGAEIMRAVRAHLDDMVAANARIRAARDARVAELERRTNLIVAMGTAGGVLGGVVAALLFTTGVARRLDAATRNMVRLSAREPLDPIAPAGDEIGVLTAGTERADRLLAQRDAELQHRMHELESLTRELEAFSYSVSHDLRAPLRHIAGFATMLQKSGGDRLTDQQQRYIRTIVEAAARMGRLIDDLLAFSRTGRAELRHRAVDVAAVVADVREQLTSELNGRNVRWIVGPLPTVLGDPAMLRVVFDNLLANAVKYTRPREQAEIEIGSRAGEGGDAVVYVRDNGVGFDMKYEHKLFGVFQRLHSSDVFEGTGIGLATVRRIVARHGGRAWAEGRPGDGATFYVALPTAERAV